LDDKSVIPLEPKYMIFTTEETKKNNFLSEIDKYGESYTKDATIKSLKEVFSASNSIENDEMKEVKYELDVLKVEQKYFHKKCWWGVFRNYIIYLDRFLEVGNPKMPIPNSNLELVAHILCFYGATISDTIDQSVTHVVVNRADLSRIREIRAQAKSLLAKPPHLAKHIVSMSWVTESANCHEDLDEGEFTITAKEC